MGVLQRRCLNPPCDHHGCWLKLPVRQAIRMAREENDRVTEMQELMEDRVVLETDRLARRIVMEDVREVEQISQAEVCLRHCVDKMLERHSRVFGGMMVRLNIDRTIDFRQGFAEVAEELFRDAVSWSKIVALFAFGARLGQHCRESGRDELTEEVAGSLAFFARERITPFIREQGGWETLSQVFPLDPEDPESRVWRGLLLVGITLGVLTLFLAARR